MNTPVVNGPPMRRMKEADGTMSMLKSAEKFISSLKLFVWCEWPCRNSTSHEGRVWGIDALIARFLKNPGSFGRD